MYFLVSATGISHFNNYFYFFKFVIYLIYRQVSNKNKLGLSLSKQFILDEKTGDKMRELSKLKKR